MSSDYTYDTFTRDGAFEQAAITAQLATAAATAAVAARKD